MTTPNEWSAGDPPMDKAKREAMPGVTGPVGYFDPVGISSRVPEGLLMFYREAELKHGRVCMLAILGLIVGERHDFVPLLGDGIPLDKPAFLLGTPYVQETAIAKFWPLVLSSFGLFEVAWLNSDEKKERAPGDYGWDPLGLQPKDATKLKELANKELNNGRLAMLASAGWIAQEMVEGKNLFFNK